ncbi:MAG: FadR family transcriptional regulator [Mogibacterium sp.]|nr:FadR family transcriptional regulator [Mogibacterium sp.]
MSSPTNNKLGFSPVKVERISDVIFDQIREMIISGELKPGEMLPSERQMMSIYKRSLPTVREALRMLESSGLIRVIPGEGAVVLEPDTNPLEAPLIELMKYRQIPFYDIYEFMSHSEPMFIGEIVRKRTWEDLVSLNRCLSSMESDVRDASAFFLDFFTFRKTLIHAAHNPLFSIAWDAITEMIEPPADAVCDPSRLQKEYELHKALFARLRDADPAGAREMSEACWQMWPFPLEQNDFTVLP